MSPSSNRQPRLFTWSAEIILLGLMIGIAQTTAETTGLGWLGIRVTWVDVVVWTVLYAVVAALFAVILFTGAGLFRRGPAPAARPAASARGRRLFFIGAALAYGLVGAKLIISDSRGFALLLILILFAALLVALLSMVGRVGRSFHALVLGVLTLSFSAVGAALPAAMQSMVPLAPMKWTLGASMCVLPLLGLALLARTKRPKVTSTAATAPVTGLGSGALLLGLMLVANLILATKVWPVELGWHVDRPNPQHSAGGAGKPNVLLVVLDTVRAQSLDLFGYQRPTMPRLKRFAETECHYYAAIQANAPATLPTHGSLFTGHFSHSHGAHKPFLLDENPPVYGYFLREDLPTLAGWLTGAGYRTAGIMGNYGVLSSFGLRRGFGYYDVRPSDSKLFRAINWLYASTTHKLGLRNGLSRLLPDRLVEATVSLNPWAPPFQSAEQINRRVFDWLDGPGRRPFFMFVNYMDAHDPYLPPAEYRHRFGPRDHGIDWIGFPEEHYRRAVYEQIPVPREDAEYARAQYDAMLNYLDDQVDHLLQHMRDIGRYDDTLIIIVSDHGEEFNEHGLMRHGSTLYEPQVSVPLLVKFPSSVNDPPVVSSNFQHVDVFPSILDLLQIEPPAELQGSAWGAGRDYTLTEVFVRNRKSAFLRRELCAVRRGQLKYIRSTTGEEEVYDLATDPQETRNLWGTRPEVEASFQETLTERNQKITQQILRGREDEELVERLRSLGYLQ